MIIYLLRHAIAVPRGDKQYPGDDRPLTPDGVEKMKRNTAGMLALGLEFDAVLHSRLRRSRDTARIVKKAMDLRCPLSSTDALLPGADPGEVLREIAGSKALRSVLLVGHEPHLGMLASALIGSQVSSVIFKKGGIARIDAGKPAPGSGRLAWLLTPRQLRMMGTRR